MYKMLIWAFIFFSGTWPVHALHDQTDVLNQEDIRKTLLEQGVGTEMVDKVIATLRDQTEEELQLSAIITLRGINGGLFVDNDHWNTQVTLVQGGEKVNLWDAFGVHYYNGGLSAEFGFKWIWIFLPHNTPLSSLDGAVFGGPVWGRGLSLGVRFLLGIRGGWMHRLNRPGYEPSAFIVSAGIGVGLGLTFPRLEFYQNDIVEVQRQ